MVPLSLPLSLSFHCRWQFYFIRSDYNPYLLLMIVNKAIRCKFLHISLSFCCFGFVLVLFEWNWQLKSATEKGPQNGIILLPNGIVIEIKNYLNAHFCFLWSILYNFDSGFIVHVILSTSPRCDQSDGNIRYFFHFPFICGCFFPGFRPFFECMWQRHLSVASINLNIIFFGCSQQRNFDTYSEPCWNGKSDQPEKIHLIKILGPATWAIFVDWNKSDRKKWKQFIAIAYFRHHQFNETMRLKCEWAVYCELWMLL